MKRPLCCVCIAFVVTVFLYLELNPTQPPSYTAEEGCQVTLLGEVSQKEYKEETLVLTLQNVKRRGAEGDLTDEKCGVLCYLESSEDVCIPRLGSIVAVEGKVSCFQEVRNPGGFDAKKYYQILGIGYRLYKAELLAESSSNSLYKETLYKIRSHFEGIFDSILPAKEASIMKAMVLGSKSGIDSESKQLYQKSGIAHVFAISGLHITLLGMGLYQFLRKIRLPQIVAVALSIGIMIAYGDMVGMSSSARRAVFMFGMKLVADLLKRTYDMLTALAIAAVLILVEQPLYIYHSGFLLSFSAILGVGGLSEVVMPARKTGKYKFLDTIISSLCGSLSIFLIHFPIMLCVYYEFPVYSFLLNLVVIPAMTFVMVGGILCLAFGSLPMAAGIGIAKIAGLVCQLFLSSFEWLSTVTLKLPFANWIVGRPDNWRIYFFLASVLVLYLMHNYGKKISKDAICEKQGICIGLALPIKLILVLLAVALISSKPTSGASITFVDVGQGDCIWIESAKGEHFLVDGGSTSQSKVGEYTIVPYLKYMGVSKIDAVFLTHLDSDHISGIMEMLDGNFGIAIDKICISNAVIEDEAYEKLENLCTKNNVLMYRLQTGDCIEAYGLNFEVIHPSGTYQAESRNAYSLVMKLTISDKVNKMDTINVTNMRNIVSQANDIENKNITVLLTGDVEADGEQAAAEQLVKQPEFSGIDIYKAAHHGSKYSNTEALITIAQPSLAIISCGENNRYGHPHTETLENFYGVGSQVLITKDTGAIMLHIKDGECTISPYIKGKNKSYNSS